MNNPRQPNNRADDEIDLNYFFSKIGLFFNGVSHQTKKGGRAIIKNWVPLLFFALVGAGLGFAAYKSTRPYYTSSMTLVLAEIRNELVEDLLSNLDIMVREKNSIALAKNLKISEEQASQVKNLAYKSIDQDRTDKDSILIAGPLTVTVTVFDNSLFDTLETGITNYLESNKYFSKNKRVRQETLESLIIKLDKDLASIDSIREVAVTPRGPANGFVYGEALDPTNLYREGVVILEKKAYFEAELKKLDNLQVVTGFAPRFRPTGPNLIIYVLVGALTSFIIALILLIIRDRKQRIYINKSIKKTTV